MVWALCIALVAFETRKIYSFSNVSFIIWHKHIRDHNAMISTA